MKVRMVRIFQTSRDGIHVDLYKPGQKYDLPEVLALDLLKAGIAIEDKDMETAPEMKMVAPQVTKPKRRKG
jgi:hypothetical protein